MRSNGQGTNGAPPPSRSDVDTPFLGETLPLTPTTGETPNKAAHSSQRWTSAIPKTFKTEVFPYGTKLKVCQFEGGTGHLTRHQSKHALRLGQAT
ncbi:hypothetical protein NL676_022624 [Syzygium grande]|nr:hypothetical protein NL676_022624 [Syzygium grande]